MPDTLANNILAIRKRWGMEQTEFAELLGVSRFVSSNWEKGRNPPSLAVAAKLEQLTGLSLGVLLEQPLTGNEIPEVPGGVVGETVFARLERMEGMLRRLVGE